MNIKINNISGEGFLCFYDEFKIDFTNLNNKIIQISGENLDDFHCMSNGSGKSSLIELILYALYDKIYRKNRYAEEIISKNKDICFVSADINIDEDNFIIERTRARSSKSLKIYKNGEELWKDSTDTFKQKKIEEMIGMNFLSFTCSIVFGQDFISFPNLLPSERSNLLENILDLSKYTESAKLANKRVDDIEKKITEINGKVLSKEGELKRLESQTYKDKIEEFENVRIQKVNNRKERVKELSDRISKDEEDNKNRISVLQEEVKKYEDKIKHKDRIERVLNRLREERASAITSRMSLASSLQTLKEEIKTIDSIKDSKCPTCKQIVPDDYKETFKNESNEILNKSLPILEKREEVLTELENKCANFDKQLKDIERYTLNIESMNSEIEIISKRQKPNGSIIETLNREIEELRNDKNPYLDIKEKNNEDIVKVNEELSKLNEVVADLTTTQKYYEYWNNGFKKIKVMLFSDIVDKFEDIAQDILSQYSSDIKVEFSLERATKTGDIKNEFHITVTDSDGPISYNMYSGGQKKRIQLALSIALSKLIKEKCNRDFNIIAFDEMNDSLDDMGKDINFKILQDLLDDDKIILITDHDSFFKDKFEHSINIVRKDGKSIIS